MTRAHITIPRTPLGLQLSEADAIKREMTELLSQLEFSAIAGTDNKSVTDTKPGGWRHDPTGWAKRNKTGEPRA